MKHVGYKLIEVSSGSVVATFGGVYGQDILVPNPLALPNGDQVFGASVEEPYAGFVLKDWFMDDPRLSLPLSELKADLVAATKHDAYSLLLPSDWMIVRKIEAGTEIPAEYSAHRAAIRTKSEEACASINAAADNAAAIDVYDSIQWPVLAAPEA